MKKASLYVAFGAVGIVVIAIFGAFSERILIEKERQRKANWIANFPFQPTYHPTITFDPKVMERKVDERGMRIRTEEYKVLRRLIDRHVFAKTMYEDHEREMYSPEFEKMHHILSEYLENDPVIWGTMFDLVRDYHLADSEEKREKVMRGFLGWLTPHSKWNGVELLSREQAIEVRDRLIEELPADVMLKHRPIIPHHKYEKMLQKGDALLIR